MAPPTLYEICTHKVSGFAKNVYSATPHPTYSYEALLNGNALFVREYLARDPQYFQKLSAVHQPGYFFIACSDARVPPNQLTKTEPGELFIYRNIANQVHLLDLGCLSALQYAVKMLQVQHIVVMGHTHCGGIVAANSNESLGKNLDLWLQGIKDLAITYQESLSKAQNEKEFLDQLAECNVRQQVIYVQQSEVVQQAQAQGQKVKISGWICDIETGIIRDLEIPLLP